MPRRPGDPLRAATPADGEQLLRLRDLLSEGEDEAEHPPWRGHARAWFEESLDDPTTVRLPVLESDDLVVSAAVGTLELGVPDPWCPRGRTVRLANVVTLPAHRGRCHVSLLVRDVVEWARAVAADRVDLSAMSQGRGVYERAGFVLTSAPRTKLVLGRPGRAGGGVAPGTRGPVAWGRAVPAW